MKTIKFPESFKPEAEYSLKQEYKAIQPGHYYMGEIDAVIWIEQGQSVSDAISKFKEEEI